MHINIDKLKNEGYHLSLHKIEFGFLDYPHKINFKIGEIVPVEDFKSIKTQVDKWKHQDGFIYPSYSWIADKNGGKKENTERPAPLWRPPPSHILVLEDDRNKDDLMKSNGLFILYSLAYLFGTRLQFCDWWFDSRIPLKSKHHVHLKGETIEHFMSTCYSTWSTWNDKKRTLMSNLLFMHTKTPSYQWDWERFTIEYMVNDACYRLFRELHPTEKEEGDSKKRIKQMLSFFKIPIGVEGIKKEVDKHCEKVKKLSISKNKKKIYEEIDTNLSLIKKMYSCFYYGKNKENLQKRKEIASKWQEYYRQVESVTDNDNKAFHRAIKKYQKEIDAICRKVIKSKKEIAIQSIKEISRLRNDLFHESLWDKGQPCSVASSVGFQQQFNLRNINQRLIPALFGYNTDYIETPWWTRYKIEFKKAE